MILVFHTSCCPSTFASSRSITILLASITSPLGSAQRVWPCTTSSYLLYSMLFFSLSFTFSEEINGSQLAAASSTGSHYGDDGCFDCSCILHVLLHEKLRSNAHLNAHV